MRKATLEANGTIVFDPKLKMWVMYCLAFASNWPGESADRIRLYRFTSSGAVSWRKGSDGTPQRIAVDLHDRKSNTSATNIDLFFCAYDKTDAVHPYKGWLFLPTGDPPRGTYFVQSADGIQWEHRPAGARRWIADLGARWPRHEWHRRRDDFLSRPPAKPISGLPALCFATDVENTNRLRTRGFLFTEQLDQPIDLPQVSRLNLVPEGASAMAICRLTVLLVDRLALWLTLAGRLTDLAQPRRLSVFCQRLRLSSN